MLVIEDHHLIRNGQQRLFYESLILGIEVIGQQHGGHLQPAIPVIPRIRTLRIDIRVFFTHAKILSAIETPHLRGL